MAPSGGEKAKSVVRQLRLQVPLADGHRVLRDFVLRLVGDHQLARQRLPSGIDPDLPVDGRLLERQVVARHTCRLVDAQVHTTLHVTHQPRVDVGIEEVPERDDRACLLEDPIKGLVDGRRYGAARPHVLLFVVGCEHLSVVPERPMHGVARRIADEAIGTPHRDAAQVRELSPGALVRHFVVDLLGFERKRASAGKPLAHLPHELVGPGIDET